MTYVCVSVQGIPEPSRLQALRGPWDTIDDEKRKQQLRNADLLFGYLTVLARDPYRITHVAGPPPPKKNTWQGGGWTRT